MPQRLGQMTLGSAGGADDEHRGVLTDEAARGEVGELGAVERHAVVEVEALEGFVGEDL